MIAIKIQCGCGQRYAFDVEPVQGRMPYAVVCPACGVDGTTAANELISTNLPLEIPPPPTPANAAVSPSVHRGSPAPTGPRRATVLPGTVDRTQAQHEARARILWGDAPEEVVRLLMGHGIPISEATAMVEELFEERAATIRSNGIEKVVIGGVLVLIPFAAWFYFSRSGFIPVKFFGFTIVAGLCGVWLVIKGVIMIFAPKSASGDASAQ